MWLRRKWRAWRALSPDERSMFLSAWLKLIAADAILRLRGYRAAERWVGRTRHSERSANLAEGRVAELAAAAARDHLWPMTCLRQALVVRKLLAERGTPSEIRFGVQRDGDALQAHAWVEVEGAPLGPQGNSAAGTRSLMERDAP